MVLCISKMIVFSMAHMEYSAFQPVILCIMIPYLLEGRLSSSLVYSGAFFCTGILYFRFVCGAISEICDHLGIQCFKVKKQKEDGPTLAIPQGSDKATDAAKSPTGTNC